MDHYRAVVAGIKDKKLPCFLGGKMMGAWIASLLISGKDSPKEELLNLNGLIALGYPFEGYDEIRTSEHLDDINMPFLFACGENDMFAQFFSETGTAMKSNFHMKWVKDSNMHYLPKSDMEGKLVEDKP